MMTIPIQTLAGVLMVAHLGSDVFMSIVLKRQYGLFSKPITPNDQLFRASDIHKIKNFRLKLFLLSAVILFGNTIPIVIDGITVFGDNALHRNPYVPLISLMYAVSNAMTALISAYLINTLYRIARSANDPNELVENEVQKS